MSESDEETITNTGTILRNGFPFNSTNASKYSVNPSMTGIGFRKNVTNSTFNEPINYSRYNFGGHGFDQRSIYYRRETSPMSMVHDLRPHYRDYSYCQSEMGTHRSIISGRSGSIRSNDTISSAVDIAEAIRNAKFNKNDLSIIKQALSNYNKNRSRRRIEKRRKLRRFFRSNRTKCGDDSGEQGSDSASSSDDLKSTRSIKTLNPKENILKPRNRNDMNKFNRTMKENSLYRNNTENLKHSSSRNIFTGTASNNDLSNRTLYKTQEDRVSRGFLLPSQRFNKFANKPMSSRNLESSNVCTVIGYSFSRDKTDQNKQEAEQQIKINNNLDNAHEEIFPIHTKENGYSNNILSKTIAVQEVENSYKIDKNVQSSTKAKHVYNNIKSTDFNFKKPDIPFRKQFRSQREPIVEKPSIQLLHPQGNNLNLCTKSSPIETIRNKEKSNEQPKNSNSTLYTNYSLNKNKMYSSNDETDSDEIFANTTVKENNISNNSLAQKRPLEDNEMNCSEKKRSKIVSQKTQAKTLIVKMNNAINDDNIEKEQNNVDKNTKNNSNEPIRDHYNDVNFYESTETQSNKSCFEKSSFIKRKLFTQKLDMMDNKILNVDNLNSPQINHNLREKNKVRKLATSQSCLNRDVLDEDNVLDLIHKIVPPEQMNLTNATNKTATRNSNQNEDKWDVASVISKYDTEDVSDTYTDEEVLQVNSDINKSKNDTTENPSKTRTDSTRKCKVVVEKLQKVPHNLGPRTEITQNKKDFKEPMGTNKRTAPATKTKSFWDTDSESEMEGKNKPSRKPIISTKQGNEPMEIAAKTLNETKSFRVAMLTLHSLKNSFISSVRKSSNLITSQKLNNVSSNNCVAKANGKTTMHNEQTRQNVTESKSTLNKKDLLINGLEANKSACRQKKEEIVQKPEKTNTSGKCGEVIKNKKKITNGTEIKNSNKEKIVSNKKSVYKKKEQSDLSKSKYIKDDAKQKKSSTVKKKPTKTSEKIPHTDSVSSNDRSILTRSLTKTKLQNNNSITSNFNTNNVTKYGHKLLFDISISSGEHSILTRSMSLRTQNKDMSNLSINLSNPKPNSKQVITQQNSKKTLRNGANFKGITNKTIKTKRNSSIIAKTPRRKKNESLNRNYYYR